MWEWMRKWLGLFVVLAGAVVSGCSLIEEAGETGPGPTEPPLASETPRE